MKLLVSFFIVACIFGCSSSSDSKDGNGGNSDNGSNNDTRIVGPWFSRDGVCPDHTKQNGIVFKSDGSWAIIYTEVWDTPDSTYCEDDEWFGNEMGGTYTWDGENLTLNYKYKDYQFPGTFTIVDDDACLESCMAEFMLDRSSYKPDPETENETPPPSTGTMCKTPDRTFSGICQ